VRNTKVVDIINELKNYGANITIHDPWADEEQVMHEYGLKSSKFLLNEKFDALVLAVAHNKFNELDFTFLKNKNSIIYDVKNFLPKSITDGRL
jgi:UDP-N-acetyl-D-galactosamine dehydrogenase